MKSAAPMACMESTSPAARSTSQAPSIIATSSSERKAYLPGNDVSVRADDPPAHEVRSGSEIRQRHDDPLLSLLRPRRELASAGTIRGDPQGGKLGTFREFQDEIRRCGGNDAAVRRGRLLEMRMGKRGAGGRHKYAHQTRQEPHGRKATPPVGAAGKMYATCL